jgi:3',5'-cyclic-AMP phosphodiesterase
MNRPFFRQIALILLLVPFLAQACLGATLYERSLAQFKANALKAAPNDFTFVVLGDSRGGDAVLKKALRKAKSYRPLFILHGGDYSDSGGEGETASFLSLANQSIPEVPLFVVMGNHENRQVFDREIGPSHFTLDSKRLRLVLVAVDDSEYALRPLELDYLRSQLAPPRRAAFIAMHVPPKTERWSWHTFTDGAEDLKAIIAKYPLQGLFFSHVHLFDRSEFAGVPAIITGGAGAPLLTMGFPGDPVYHIVVVRVKNGKASFHKVPLSEK